MTDGIQALCEAAALFEKQEQPLGDASGVPTYTHLPLEYVLAPTSIVFVENFKATVVEQIPNAFPVYNPENRPILVYALAGLTPDGHEIFQPCMVEIHMQGFGPGTYIIRTFEKQRMTSAYFVYKFI
jgi:hypothetical protein